MQRRTIPILGFLIILLAFAMSLNMGCYYDNEQDLYPDNSCDTVNVSYSAVVQPLIETACYACHDAANNLGNVTLEGYNDVKTYVDNGLLLGAIKREPGFSPMPQNQAPLPQCNIDKIEAWILDGALDN